MCQDLDGDYIKILTKKGVALCTGDFASNKKMLASLVPWAANYMHFFNSRDAKGNPTNTGDGQIMGVWAGAKMENGPHAPMTHTLGGPLGVDAFFLANVQGERFVNEDVGGQQLSSAIERQPKNYAWQIFDDKWPEQIGSMGVSHGSVNYCVPEEKNPRLPGTAFTIGKTSFVSRESVRNYRGIKIADSLDELVASLDLDEGARKRLLESIERYNKLCHEGKDEDFGKTPKRMFPIETPPFYAARLGTGGMLVCMGGLTCDPYTANVLDEDYKGIPGLYAAGNTMGGRYLGDYPVVLAGTSHGMALVYGRLAGTVLGNL